MMSLSLDFLWDFIKPILSDRLKEQLNKSGEAKAKQDLMSLHKILFSIESQTEFFVASLGELVAFDRDKLTTEGKEKIYSTQRYAQELLHNLLELAGIMNKISPALSVYKYGLIQEIESYRSSRGLVISKLEEEIDKIAAGDYSSQVINELYLKSLENLDKIKTASKGIREFIAEQFEFKDLY